MVHAHETTVNQGHRIELKDGGTPIIFKVTVSQLKKAPIRKNVKQFKLEKNKLKYLIYTLQFKKNLYDIDKPAIGS